MSIPLDVTPRMAHSPLMSNAAALPALRRAYAAARTSAKTSLPILSSLSSAEVATLRALGWLTAGGSCGDLQITMRGMLAMEEPKAAPDAAPKAERAEIDLDAFFASVA